MKVLLINGSPRANGNTARALGRNMAWLLKNLKSGDAIPRSADEPWQPMHFIR